ncbi:hypothetical protein ABT160_05455 [Streptomyces sp. NPDC001941]|uniref:hypothetical protein n=1 Tax=Streptomyces sp. NPDC001941 TaxID=3154659 RepID=UPI00331F3442
MGEAGEPGADGRPGRDGKDGRDGGTGHVDIHQVVDQLIHHYENLSPEEQRRLHDIFGKVGPASHDAPSTLPKTGMSTEAKLLYSLVALLLVTLGGMLVAQVRRRTRSREQE